MQAKSDGAHMAEPSLPIAQDGDVDIQQRENTVHSVGDGAGLEELPGTDPVPTAAPVDVAAESPVDSTVMDRGVLDDGGDDGPSLSQEVARMLEDSIPPSPPALVGESLPPPSQQVGASFDESLPAPSQQVGASFDESLPAPSQQVGDSLVESLPEPSQQVDARFDESLPEPSEDGELEAPPPVEAAEVEAQEVEVVPSQESMDEDAFQQQMMQAMKLSEEQHALEEKGEDAQLEEALRQSVLVTSADQLAMTESTSAAFAAAGFQNSQDVETLMYDDARMHEAEEAAVVADLELDRSLEQTSRGATLGRKPASTPMRNLTKEQLVDKIEMQFKVIEDEAMAEGANTLDKAASCMTTFFQGSLIHQLRSKREKPPDSIEAEITSQVVTEAERKEMEAEAKLWAHVEAQGFEFSTAKIAGNPMGGRWDRALNNDASLKKQYMETKGYANKREFRSSWATKEHLKWQEKQKRVQATIHEKIEEKGGEYMTMGRIAHKLGGGSVGNRLACRYCGKAVVMGGIWVKWCEMTDSLMFLWTSHKFKDVYTKSWAD
ncbi:unnamed protein product [Prorocentrum cordatum]|uniref:Uncharacterized protein n=1 Tax=Prorocentrum cordatum TaxID=2364126 RepID=A0ABN9WMR3_9DINO|nr:unnamed protein product [Polarella glacialis]